MLKQRILALFRTYDPTLRQVIQEVGELEQRLISMERPRGVYEEIDDILSRIAEQELDKLDSNVRKEKES